MEKEDFLKELNEVSKPKTHKKKARPRMKDNKVNNTSVVVNDKGEEILVPPLSEVIGDKLNNVTVTKADWDRVFDNISADPIDELAQEGKRSYKNKKEDEYDDLFSKEYSMINSVISSLQDYSKNIDKQIKNLDTGSKGVGKFSSNGKMIYTELQNTALAIQNSKLQAIKSLTDIKKTAADLKLKKEKVSPSNNDDQSGVVANEYYNQIMSSGQGMFTTSILANLSNKKYDDDGVIRNEYDVNIDDDMSVYDKQNLFNPSQPIDMIDNIMPSEQVDEYGYIVNEKKDIEIVIEFDKDTLSKRFVAIDNEGYEVPDVELPGSDLLNDIKIDPYSKYVSDKYSRRYKVIMISADDNIITDI